MSAKIKMKEEPTEVDRRLAEGNARLTEHNHRLDDYKKKPTPSFESTMASLMICSFGFLFGLGFTLADMILDSLFCGGE